jgi:DMSO/TMAO reductase YedYZ molybdopterin-dependent catalytic subunit
MSKEPKDAKHEMRQISRKSFMWAGFAVLGGYSTIKYLSTRLNDGGTPWPFRRVLEFNESVWKDFYQPKPVHEFPKSAVTPLRVNGAEGLSDDFDPAAWTLSVEGIAGADGPVTVTMAELKKMPRTEMTTEICCIEGWSSIVSWAGVRFSDFMKKHPPATKSGEDPNIAKNPTDLMDYVYLETPDAGYYVGLDMPSALHPNTILCYEMNGEPLPLEHGAPLRLVIPVKYGIKNIKRIGTIRYTNARPADYWAEEGYDWYAGL